MNIGGEFSTFPSLRTLESLVQSSLGKCGPWTSSFSITWELVGNAEHQAPPQACGVSVCILNRSLETCMHLGVKSIDVYKCSGRVEQFLLLIQMAEPLSLEQGPRNFIFIKHASLFSCRLM